MNKMLKFRFLLPLLVLGYAVAGGFVAPRAGVVGGHLIMMALVVLVGVFAFQLPKWFKRKFPKEPKVDYVVVGQASWLLIIAAPLIFITHVIIMATGHAFFWAPELWAIVIMVLIGTLWGKERYRN